MLMFSSHDTSYYSNGTTSTVPSACTLVQHFPEQLLSSLCIAARMAELCKWSATYCMHLMELTQFEWECMRLKSKAVHNIQ